MAASVTRAWCSGQQVSTRSCTNSSSNSATDKPGPGRFGSCRFRIIDPYSPSSSSFSSSGTGSSGTRRRIRGVRRRWRLRSVVGCGASGIATGVVHHGGKHVSSSFDRIRCSPAAFVVAVSSDIHSCCQEAPDTLLCATVVSHPLFPPSGHSTGEIADSLTNTVTGDEKLTGAAPTVSSTACFRFFPFPPLLGDPLSSSACSECNPATATWC